MTSKNTKRVEETAVNALKAALLRCEYLESFIGSNDKTPVWDGTVNVYNSEYQRTADLIGRVPIQIKGTEKAIVSDIASFSCKVTHLENYYRDGGCIFFLVSVDSSNGKATIFYSVLQVFDLKKILDNASQKQNITIRLNRFPENDKHEIVSIFTNFIVDKRKQTSFIGKELLTLEQLEENGARIESLSFSAAFIEPTRGSIGKYLSTHDFYVYAKPIGLDIEIPVEKISNAIVSTPVFGNVIVHDVEYYPSYQVIFENGTPIINIGTGIRMSLDYQEYRLTLTLRPKGTLSDVIRDMSCYISMLEYKEVILNGVRLPLNTETTEIGGLEQYKAQLQYNKDVKRMLDLLGVTEELQCDNLSQTDLTNIRNFVNAVLYNKGIGFPNATDAVLHIAFKIANLSIWILAIRRDDGYYKIDNFFNAHRFVTFENDDVAQNNPIAVSHFLWLDKDAFIHTSNMDYEMVGKSISNMPHHQLLADYTTYLCLNVLRGYDEQQKKDEHLLDLADTICDWLAGFEDLTAHDILVLNRMQIKKRRQLLDIQDILELAKLTEKDKLSNIRCGAYLLLGDTPSAQKCFDELDPTVQKEFITFPICHFGELSLKEQSN